MRPDQLILQFSPLRNRQRPRRQLALTAALTGVALPLAAVALIQITLGASILVRRSNDVARVRQIVQNAPLRVPSEEVPRMRQVIANFELYRRLEIGLLAAGLMVAALAAHRPTSPGAGLGLALQAGLVLLDLFAESLGTTCLAWLLREEFQAPERARRRPSGRR